MFAVPPVGLHTWPFVLVAQSLVMLHSTQPAVALQTFDVVEQSVVVPAVQVPVPSHVPGVKTAAAHESQ